MPAGILTVILRSCADAPRAVAGLARLGDGAACAPALRTGRRDGEKALLPAHLPLAAAHQQVVGWVPGAAPEPLQVSQFSWRGIWMDVSVPLGCFLERDLEVVAQVGSALRTAAPASAAEQSPKPNMLPRMSAKSPKSLNTEGRIRRRRRPPAHALMAETIVEAALLRIGQDRVRFRRLLEALFRGLVPGIAIRVILHRELAICALQLASAAVSPTPSTS